MTTLDAIAVAAKAHWGYAQEDMERWQPSLHTSAESVANWPTYVAECDGQVTGFVQADPRSEPWELVSLWVLPQFMRRGIGQTLLKTIAAEAGKAGQINLAIDSDPNAEPFYRLCGAVVVGHVPAPTRRSPDRTRPQLVLPVRADPSLDRGHPLWQAAQIER